jgi:hypothetical protein
VGSEMCIRDSTRVAHLCQYCHTVIPKKSRCIRQAGVFDGDFFWGYGHADCKELWEELFPIYGDSECGMPFNILEAVAGGEGYPVILECLEPFRGRYPHAVTRIDLRAQIYEIKYGGDN